MDAVEFIKAYRRLCQTYIPNYCEGCPLTPLGCGVDDLGAVPEDLVKITEEWQQEHPAKTMVQDFFEKHPNAPKDKDNMPRVCPNQCGYTKELEDYKICEQFNDDCEQCWNQPIE